MVSRADSLCVIVLSYFGARRIERCVESLLNQGIDTLYLVDNSSDAIEAARIREVHSRLLDRGPEFDVHVLVNDENVGFARGINRTVKADLRSGGHDCYLLLNDDAVLPPQGAAELLRVFNSRDDIALVSGRIVSQYRDTRFVWYHRWLGHLSWKPTLGTFPFLLGTCLLIDRRCMTGGEVFDEAFFMYGEDVALTWKAMQQGLAIECADAVVVAHEGSASSQHGEFFYEYHMARAHVLLVKRLARYTWEIPLMYFGRIAYLVPRAIVRAIRYRRIDPLRALLAAWFSVDARFPAPRR